MNITQLVIEKINTLPTGKVFGYQELPNYNQSSGAVITSVSRLVAQKKLMRLSKGKFYVPKQGVFGQRNPSEQEILRSVLYKNNRLAGYVTGPSLYNQLGLTTQVPRTVTIACNGGRQVKEFKTIRIKKITTRVPIEEKNIRIMQYLDVLKDIRRIPDADINVSLKRMCRFIDELSANEQRRLIDLASRYYTPQVKALIGMLYTRLARPISKDLIESLNPITVYKLNLDKAIWPEADKWNIK